MPEPVVKDIRPDEAHALLRRERSAVLLDVRTTMEYLYVGHPVGALHVPWMEAPEWRILPGFAERVAKALGGRSGAEPVQELTVLALCRSGKRSRAAAEELAHHGFTRLYNVVEGFEGDLDADRHRSTLNGWRQRGLPWEQS